MRRLAPGPSALWLLLLMGAGCGDVRDLFSLGAALNREHHGTRVGVSLANGLILTVTMADSPLLQASCDSQAVLAMRVATFVRNHYGSFDSLQSVHVAFTSRQAGDTTPNRAARLPFRFARTAVSAGLGASDSTRAVDSCRAWDELH